MKKTILIIVILIVLIVVFFGWQSYENQVRTSKFEDYIKKYDKVEFRAEYSFSIYNKKDGLNEWTLIANHKSGKKSLLTKYSENKMTFGLFNGKYSTGCQYYGDWNCGPEFLLIPYDIAPTMSEAETEGLNGSYTKTIAGEQSECFTFSSGYGDKGRFCFNKDGVLTEVYLSNQSGDWIRTIATKVSKTADEIALSLPN